MDGWEAPDTHADRRSVISGNRIVPGEGGITVSGNRLTRATVTVASRLEPTALSPRKA